MIAVVGIAVLGVVFVVAMAVLFVTEYRNSHDDEVPLDELFD